MAVAFFDQFLGLDVSRDGMVVLANSGSLFSYMFYDGEIITFDVEDPTVLDIPYFGAPLQNPFSIEIVE